MPAIIHSFYRIQILITFLQIERRASWFLLKHFFILPYVTLGNSSNETYTLQLECLLSLFDKNRCVFWYRPVQSSCPFICKLYICKMSAFGVKQRKFAFPCYYKYNLYVLAKPSRKTATLWIKKGRKQANWDKGKGPCDLGFIIYI